MPNTPKPVKPLSAADKSYRRQCALAVLGGLYASYGTSIMEATSEDRALSIRSARRIAFRQADEMLRGEPA